MTKLKAEYQSIAIVITVRIISFAPKSFAPEYKESTFEVLHKKAVPS